MGADGKYHLPLVSASQQSTYESCARKWGFTYLSGIREPGGPATDLGKEVDDEQIQPYLRDGRAFDYSRKSGSGYIAASGLAFLPKPQTPGLEVQKHFTMPSPTWADGTDGRTHVGFGFQGYMDLWLPDSGPVPGFTGGVPFVGDFKTSKDIGKWAKGIEALKIDIQAMTYAMAAMFITGAREVDMGWLYMQTQGPRKAKRTDFRVGAAHVAERFGLINETAVEMFRIRQSNPDPLDLPPTPSSCNAFGRPCFFSSKCNLSPAQMIAGLEPKKEEMTMADSTDLLAQLKAKKLAALGGAPQPAAPTPEPAPALPVVAQVAPAPVVSTAPALGVNPPESKLPPAEPTGTATKAPKPPKATTAKAEGAASVDLAVRLADALEAAARVLRGAA